MFNFTPEEIQYMLLHLHENRGPTLIGVTCMFLLLCFTTTSARFLARRVTRAPLAVDDYLVLIALFLFVGLSTVCFLFVHYGIGKHVLALTPAAARPNGILTLALQLTYTATITVAKLSLLMLYRRIFTFEARWFRVGWWMNLTFLALYFTGVNIDICLQCLPESVDHLWNLQASCHPNFAVAKIIGGVNAFLDITLLILPIPMVWKLQMPRKRKMVVSGIFGIGLLGCIVSIFRIPALGAGWDDFTYNVVPNLIWTICEPAVAIICACLPLLRPLFRRKPLNKTTPWIKNDQERGRVRPLAAAAAVNIPTPQMQHHLLRDTRSTPVRSSPSASLGHSGISRNSTNPSREHMI